MTRILKDDLIKGICFECGKKVENDVICKDCIEVLRKKLFGFKFDEEWVEDIIWCHTQLYRKFSYNGNNYVLYLRLKGADPFQLHIWLIDSGNKKESEIHDPIVAWSEDLAKKFRIYATSKDDIKDIELVAEYVAKSLAESNFAGILWDHFASCSMKNLTKPSSAELFAPIDFFVKLKNEKTITDDLYYTSLEENKFYKMSTIENYEYNDYFGKKYVLDKKSKFRIELIPVKSIKSDTIKDFEIIVEEV